MKNKKKEEKPQVEHKIASIIEANIGKRVIASLLDGCILVFLFFLGCLFVTTPIANACFDYSSLQLKGQTYQVASHLYVYEENDSAGNSYFIEVKDFTEKINNSNNASIIPLVNKTNLEPTYYLEHLHYYYSSFLTGENVEMPNNKTDKTYDMVNDYFVSPDYLDYVKDTNTLPKDYYTDEWFNNNVLKVNDEGKDYFETSDIKVLATIKENADKEEAIKYLRNQINNAASDLYYRSFYQDINNSLKGIQLFIVLPTYVLSMCIVYLLPTLLFKNGETLAKKFLHLGVISKDGFAAKKRQYVFRFLVFFFEISLSLFVVGIGFTSLATLGIGVLILFALTMLNKDHRSLHDFAAMTLVIDVTKSVWFNSLDEESKKAQELEEKMNRYKSHKVENKNIIQIGGKVIDKENSK